jgi:hypothetical protein
MAGLCLVNVSLGVSTKRLWHTIHHSDNQSIDKLMFQCSRNLTREAETNTECKAGVYLKERTDGFTYPASLTLGRSREQWGSGTEGRHGGGGPRRQGRVVVRRRGRGEESSVERPGARGWASGIWAHDIDGGSTEVGDGVEGGDSVERGGIEVGGAKVGQPDGAKPNFTAIRVLRRRGYSPYTRYIFGIG